MDSNAGSGFAITITMSWKTVYNMGCSRQRNRASNYFLFWRRVLKTIATGPLQHSIVQ